MNKSEAQPHPDIFNEPVKGSAAKAPKLVGFHLRNPVRIFGRVWDEMDSEDKQDAMYGLQTFGGMALATAGAVAFATNGSVMLTALAAGWATTGTLNSIRSIGQYLARRKFASDPQSSHKTEFGNSFLSASTNMPQAFAGSIPGVTAVLSYGLRCMRKAMIVQQNTKRQSRDTNLTESEQERKAFARISLKSDGMEDPYLFDRSHIKSDKVDFVGPFVDGAKNAATITADAAAKAGTVVSNFNGGATLLTQGPGYIMKARALLQVAEGAVVGTTFGTMVGAPLMVAGLTYMTAAFYMKSADSSSPTPAVTEDSEMEDIKTPEHIHETDPGESDDAKGGATLNIPTIN